MFKSYVESLQKLHNSVLFVLAFHELTCLEDGEVGATSLWQSIMYQIIISEKSYICILGTYYLMRQCRVNCNELVARGQGVAGGHFI